MPRQVDFVVKFMKEQPNLSGLMGPVNERAEINIDSVYFHNILLLKIPYKPTNNVSPASDNSLTYPPLHR